MTRRTLLALPLALRLRADSAGEVWALIGDMADSLTEANAEGFLASCDPKMAGYEDLRANVTALIAESVPPASMAQSDREGIFCSIGLASEEGDDKARSVELDWIMDIRMRSGGVGSVRRQQRVKLRVEKRGKKWRVVSLDPISFFAPPETK
ncbi:MAG TPA: hypothetical protein VMU19_08775 [Bryobacteraceae bacterium]|nr:hypothetical protein [Bryobacteraceae bacterium]